jgi:hypothetical protein
MRPSFDATPRHQIIYTWERIGKQRLSRLKPLQHALTSGFERAISHDGNPSQGEKTHYKAGFFKVCHRERLLLRRTLSHLSGDTVVPERGDHRDRSSPPPFEGSRHLALVTIHTNHDQLIAE